MAGRTGFDGAAFNLGRSMTVRRCTPSRSAQMSRIKGKNTGPEVAIRRRLWQKGYRFRIHVRTHAGRADVVFLGRKLAVFVDGCFWHGCPEHYVPPRSRRDFWSTKLRNNVDRDRRQTNQLEADGWRVLRFWEHEVGEDPDGVLWRVEDALAGRWRSQGAQPRVARVDFVDETGNLELQYLEPLRASCLVKTVLRKRTTSKWRMATAPIRSRREK